MGLGWIFHVVYKKGICIKSCKLSCVEAVLHSHEKLCVSQCEITSNCQQTITMETYSSLHQ